MIARFCLVLFTSTMLFFTACAEDDGDASPDAGTDLTEADTTAPPDQGEAQPDVAVDAGAPIQCMEGADLAPLVLEPAYCVVDRFDLEDQPLTVAYADGQLWTFAPAEAPKTFAVLRRAVDVGQSTLGKATEVFSFTAETEQDVFGAEYLALSTTGAVAVGYNTSDFVNPAGEIFSGQEGEPPASVKADGNFDAAFLDPDTLLVNGLGLGEELSGQALYLLVRDEAPRKLIDALGDMSASVIVADDAVYAGGYYTAEGETRLYGFSLTEVRAAVSSGEPLSTEGDGDLVAAGGFFDAAAFGDDLLLAEWDAEYNFAGVRRVAVTVGGDAVAAGEASDVVTVAEGGGTISRLACAPELIGMLATDGDGEISLALVKER